MNRSAEIAEKTGRLTRLLAAEHLGGVLLTAQPNFAWLTAGGANGVDLSREQGACALLVRSDGKRFVLANRIEMPRLLAEELSEEDFEPIEFAWEEEKASPTFLVKRALSLFNHDVAFQSHLALGSDLPLGASARTIEGAMARCRFQLTVSEIDRFRSLGRDAGQAIGDLARRLEPGETERQVARRAADALEAGGMHAVVNLVAADDRMGKYRHPVPTGQRWEKQLMVVVCAKRNGLIASLTRIVSAGKVPDELRRRTLAAARVNGELYAATRQGATAADLYGVAARAYAAEGFAGEERLHHQGGACGYRTRDWVAHPSSAETVQAEQAFAWNPSVTGTKIEETCIASDEGREVITRTDGWPQISVQVEGREYLSPDILTL